MKLKENCFYTVNNNSFDNWCFMYKNTNDNDKTYNIYGYYKKRNFITEFYSIHFYTYNEISIEKAMELFPDNDLMKINYNRKKKIKSLLGIWK